MLLALSTFSSFFLPVLNKSSHLTRQTKIVSIGLSQSIFLLSCRFSFTNCCMMPQSISVNSTADSITNKVREMSVQDQTQKAATGQDSLRGQIQAGHGEGHGHGTAPEAAAQPINTSKIIPSPIKARTVISGNGVISSNSAGVYIHSRNKASGRGNGVIRMSRTPSPPLNDESSVSYRNGTIGEVSRTDFGANRAGTRKIYKVVLTGGPCGGKTTGQARLCTFFENLGWKVFRVPEAANILLGGGVKFSELSEDQAFLFQEDLLRTMMQIESVFFSLAETVTKDVLIICDRGGMDASAFIPREKWEDILRRNNWNEVDIRDSRYNQIIHMVSAANGAEAFYTIEDHNSRSEGLELARELDHKAAQAWVGHPYFDVVDNSSDFETKVCRMIQSVCQKLGIDTRDRLQTNSRKVKFLLKSPLPPDSEFPHGFQDFSVVHDYLQTSAPKMQARLRKRGQKGSWSYTYTVRRPEVNGQVVEVKTVMTQRDYNNMLAQRDHNHLTVYKTRRCFLLNDQYFQLDIYKEPCHPRCKGLVLLETYSTLSGSELQQRLPSFLTFIREVTGDPRYSMFNLSLKEPSQ